MGGHRRQRLVLFSCPAIFDGDVATLQLLHREDRKIRAVLFDHFVGAGKQGVRS